MANFNSKHICYRLIHIFEYDALKRIDIYTHTQRNIFNKVLQPNIYIQGKSFDKPLLYSKCINSFICNHTNFFFFFFFLHLVQLNDYKFDISNTSMTSFSPLIIIVSKKTR